MALNNEIINSEIFLFNDPFNMIVSGPTKAGKSHWVGKFLKFSDKLFENPPEKIFWYYSEWQPFYNQLLSEIPQIKFIQGLPDLAALKSEPKINKIAVIDDLMLESSKDDALNYLFTKGSHHWNLSCIFIVQNLYFGGTRCLRLNAHYLVLFRSPDKLQIKCLAKQLYPGKSQFLLDVFEDVIKNGKFSPLLVDLSNDCPDNYRLRSNIFPDSVMVIYEPK